MKVDKSIAVLLTCHNRKIKTINCLKSLFQASLPKGFSLEVFLVDDGSTDGTAYAVKKDYPEVHIIQATGNLYWNRGMHLAWKTAVNTKEYDFYLWLNDDVKLFANSIDTILKDSSQDPLGNTLICGVMSSEHEKKITYGGNDENGNLLIPNGNPTQKCIEINGNFVLVTKHIFEKVGTLDPLFPHAIGDYDYGFRCIANQIECKITSEVVGYCEENSKSPIWCRPEVNFFKRLRSLYSPLGNSHPYYYSIYINRHFGFVRAIRNFISIHIRVLFPSLWIK
jgi:GT2 family glycosyltransferase